MKNNDKQNNESLYIENASDCFENSLKEKDPNKSMEKFGNGLGYILGLYNQRDPWDHYNPFKSFFTGVRPLAHDISNLLKEENTRDASDKFRTLLNTLYTSVFRNHTFKRFKSRLESEKLKQLFANVFNSDSALNKNAKEIDQTKVSNFIKGLEKDIRHAEWKRGKYDDFSWNLHTPYFEALRREHNPFAVFFGFLFSPAILTVAYLVVLPIVAAINYGVINTIHGLFSKITGHTRRSIIRATFSDEIEKKIEDITKNIKSLKAGIIDTKDIKLTSPS